VFDYVFHIRTGKLLLESNQTRYPPQHDLADILAPIHKIRFKVGTRDRIVLQQQLIRRSVDSHTAHHDNMSTEEQKSTFATKSVSSPSTRVETKLKLLLTIWPDDHALERLMLRGKEKSRKPPRRLRKKPRLGIIPRRRLAR
jgi:hypothetical protein